jgi:hypothetical protein
VFHTASKKHYRYLIPARSICAAQFLQALFSELDGLYTKSKTVNATHQLGFRLFFYHFMVLFYKPDFGIFMTWLSLIFSDHKWNYIPT